ENGLLLVLDGEPIDVFAFARTRPLADIAEAGGSEFDGLQAGLEEAAHNLVGKIQHAALGVMNDEELPRAEQFVADDEGSNGVVAGAPAGIADDVGIAFSQTGELRGIKARVHTSEDGKAPAGRHREFALLAETGGIVGIGFQNFRKNLAHGALLVFWIGQFNRLQPSPESPG